MLYSCAADGIVRLTYSNKRAVSILLFIVSVNYSVNINILTALAITIII